MAFVMICQGRALDGAGPVGTYLKSYDPDAFGGQGYINWTSDLDHAKRFATVAELLAEWKRTSQRYPIRMDGKPNRPLTAYSVSTEQVR